MKNKLSILPLLCIALLGISCTAIVDSASTEMPPTSERIQQPDIVDISVDGGDLIMEISHPTPDDVSGFHVQHETSTGWVSGQVSVSGTFTVTYATGQADLTYDHFRIRVTSETRERSQWKNFNL